MSSDPNRPSRPPGTPLRPSGVPSSSKPSKPKGNPKEKAKEKTILITEKAIKALQNAQKPLMSVNANGKKIEPGTVWVNVESNKQYVVIGVGRGEVHIQNQQDSNVKFKVPIDRFLEIYRPMDDGLNIFVPDPERFTFDRMVLYPDAVEAIELGLNRILKHDAMERVWNISKLEPSRKLGLSFYGPPGTGKTQAAKCVATKLGKKMLQCDYAQMISKWHGDTGKHIQAAFEAATKHDAILFLDEADSLVSQRVSLSADRMSIATAINSDRNVFMQELDKFKGIVIFTTNFFGNYDSAIVRRLAKHVAFRLPNEEMREKIFRIHMPNMKRVRDVSWPEVARQSKGASGGDIFQIMVNAINRASLAPDENDWWLTHEHMITETRETMETKSHHGAKTSQQFAPVAPTKLTVPPSPPPTTPTVADLHKAITKDEWNSITGEDENRLVMAIQTHLLTVEQKEGLEERNLLISDLLNGRFNEKQEGFVNAIFDLWNAKLGWQEFGFNTGSSELRAAIAKNLSGLEKGS